MSAIFRQPANSFKHGRGTPTFFPLLVFNAFALIPKCRALDSQTPIWQRPRMGITDSSFKLRADAPEGRKAIS
jgi:hypothetical protein